MSKVDKIRLQRENDNLLAVMLYAYESPEFMKQNVRFIRECLAEWYSIDKKLKEK